MIKGLGAFLASAVVSAGATPPGTNAAPDGVERDSDRVSGGSDIEESTLAHVVERNQHLRLTQVTLQDQTDHFNELVHTREWLLHPSEKLELQGNLFVVEEVLSGSGRVFVKLEPLTHARPIPSRVDFRVLPREDTGFELFLLGSGTVRKGSEPDFAVVEFSGGAAGRTRALQQFQRARRAASVVRSVPRVLSNTWGDRSRDGRISHDFIAREIEAAADLGVEVVQIDDGWQRGISSNSVRSRGRGVWSGFWANRPDFWEPDPAKFPDGLAPLARLAKSRGVSLGLWFAPDSVEEFANWRRDADCVLGLHRDFGVKHFKIDGVFAPSSNSLVNLRRFFDAVARGSGDAVIFDLDVTASLRPGYFGMMDAGLLFVENRYTDRHKYWPHQTLRNLWKLAWWIDPGRLRMEFLNGARNAVRYPDDPLSPAAYAPEAIFATVFFSNPLAWFEVSNLPVHYRDRLPPFIRLWKELRDEVFTGTILPLGQAPDGVAWCGFASLASDCRSAILLVFRELNPSSGWRVQIPDLVKESEARCHVLAGSGRARIAGGEVEVSEVEPLGFVLLRL